MRRRASLVASFLYAGHSPVAPGTVGSMAGLLVYFLVSGNTVLYGLTLALLFLLGILYAGEAERSYGKKDSPTIVIDEVSGMLLALFLVPHGIYPVVTGFLIFRVFDILKPFPAKRAERLSGSFGIMFDDVIAGLYTNLILQIIFRFLVRP